LLPSANSKIAIYLISTIKYLEYSSALHIIFALKISFSGSIEDIKSFLNTYFAKHSLPNIRINTLDTGLEFFKRIVLRCQKTDSLVSLDSFSKRTFIGNDEDIDGWVNDYDSHISLIYAEKKDCNDQELIDRIAILTLLDKTCKFEKFN
jgi:hypothetical protein